MPASIASAGQPAGLFLLCACGSAGADTGAGLACGGANALLYVAMRKQHDMVASSTVQCSHKRLYAKHSELFSQAQAALHLPVLTCCTLCLRCLLLNVPSWPSRTRASCS